MIKPNNYVSFLSENDKFDKLKELSLISTTAKKIKQFYYKGLYVIKITKCDIVGLINKNTIVISIDNNLHTINIDCFKDMQKNTKTL